MQTGGAKSQTGAQTQVGRSELAGGQSDSRTWREHLDLSVGGGGREGGRGGLGEETVAVVATREKRAMETQTQT